VKLENRKVAILRDGHFAFLEAFDARQSKTIKNRTAG
jgi:hypothetical protein